MLNHEIRLNGNAKENSLPEWMLAGAHERTGMKLLLTKKSAYDEMLELLEPEEAAAFRLIADAVGRGTEGEREAFKISLQEILGYSAMVRYCGAEEVRKEVRDQIIGRQSYRQFLV